MPIALPKSQVELEGRFGMTGNELGSSVVITRLSDIGVPIDQGCMSPHISMSRLGESPPKALKSFTMCI
jgi:hypothetical protein